MGLKGVSDKAPQATPKRYIQIVQNHDDTFEVSFSNVTAKQYLRPLLHAAEKQFRIKLAKREL